MMMTFGKKKYGMKERNEERGTERVRERDRLSTSTRLLVLLLSCLYNILFLLVPTAAQQYRQALGVEQTEQQYTTTTTTSTITTVVEYFGVWKPIIHQGDLISLVSHKFPNTICSKTGRQFEDNDFLRIIPHAHKCKSTNV